jgi:hypothetical protein
MASSAPTRPKLYVLAARRKTWRCAESEEWMPAWALHRDPDGSWAIRVWSWFDNGWNWWPIRKPRRLSLYAPRSRRA